MATLVCDMRGYRSFIILWILKSGSKTGNEIAVEIGKRKGVKPNPGTIYPALKELVEKKAIKITIKNNRKEYELTKNGKVVCTATSEQLCKIFYDLFTK
ncbi:Transcriptional regulator PadR-like family protein [uncultured archaeon]|nr:Transcriptional regulator PadR-like family protein [uncultured archaeon]